VSGVSEDKRGTHRRSEEASTSQETSSIKRSRDQRVRAQARHPIAPLDAEEDKRGSGDILFTSSTFRVIVLMCARHDRFCHANYYWLYY
jgi:hypothetical protein